MDRLMETQQNLIPLIQAGDAQGTSLARARRAPGTICGLGDVGLGAVVPSALPGGCGS